MLEIAVLLVVLVVSSGVVGAVLAMVYLGGRIGETARWMIAHGDLTREQAEWLVNRL